MLFSEADLVTVQPNGSPWVPNDNDPATVPVPLQTVIMKVDGPYTEKDRKLWTFLLHAVFDELGEKPIHELNVRNINAVFRTLGGEHDTKWLWDSARRLAKTTVEWECTLGDGRLEQGISSIFGAQLTKSARQSGILRFNFPPLLVPIIKQPTRFARLRVHFMLKLSGKYAVTLYEILEGFVNRRDQTLDVEIDELRTWLKVPEGSYKSWKDFRKWVLDPALKQINDDPMGAGFTARYTPVRKGKFYHKLIFKIDKTRGRQQADKIVKRKLEVGREIFAAKEANRPALLPDVIEQAAALTDHYLDMREMQAQFWQHWKATGCPDFERGVAAAFIGFIKKKHEQAKYPYKNDPE